MSNSDFSPSRFPEFLIQNFAVLLYLKTEMVGGDPIILVTGKNLTIN